MGYESSAERWSPVQSVEKILLSVVSMLAGKYCYQLSVCWQVNTVISCQYVGRYILLPVVSMLAGKYCYQLSVC